MCIGTFGYISGETVSELIFLKYNLDLATQDLFYTSSLWGLQERRWKLWRRWRRWTPAMLAILSSRLCFLREGEDFSVDEVKKYFYSDTWSLNACFCLNVFVFFNTSLSFPFSRDSLRRFPYANFPLIFVGTHKGRDSTFIIRMDLLPLPSSVVSAALLWVIDESHITEYRYYKTFLIFSLKHDVVMTSVKEIKRI